MTLSSVHRTKTMHLSEADTADY